MPLTDLASLDQPWIRGIIVLALLLFAESRAPHAAEPESKETAVPPAHSVPLQEQVSTRLFQLDVTVEGPAESLDNLGSNDFDVEVSGFGPIQEFHLDRVAALSPTTSKGRDDRTPASTEGTAPARYVFYFEQGHLTMSGRWRALELTRELIPKLVANRARAAIISNGTNLKTIVPFTEDRQLLLAGLKRLETDRGQWDTYGAEEMNRMVDLARTVRSGRELAIARARTLATEEEWRARKSLQRLEISLGQLADTRGVKTFVYFADTMRMNPGDHYLKALGELDGMTPHQPGAPSIALESRSPDVANLGPFRQVLTAAAASGVRFYAIEAQGMISPPLWVNRMSMEWLYDAQATLSILALATGGQAFLNGVSDRKITERILSDLASLFIISFDADPLPQDRPLSVRVTSKRRGIRVRTREQIVVQSEASLRSTRLLGAFVNPTSAAQAAPVHVNLIPSGYRDGAYLASVQVSSPGSPVGSAVWDVATSLVTRGMVRDARSGRIECAQAKVPIVFEQEMSFSPGPYELVAVVHEVTTDQVGSTRKEADWPDPDRQSITMPPFVVLQQVQAAFSKGGRAAGEGYAAVPEGLAVRADRPMAIVGIVCRDKQTKKVLRVERSLAGVKRMSFEPIDLDLREDRCAQIRDVIPAGTLGAGQCRYEVEVKDGDSVLAHTERSLITRQPTP